MQFHDLDLIRANYNARVNQILRACPLDLLISLIEEWFSIAPLKPTRLDATFDEYPTLKYKPAVLNRVHFDWPEGLTLRQVAQVDVAYATKTSERRELKLWKLTPKGRKGLSEALTSEDTRNQFENALQIYYKCYVYVERNNDATEWIRIAFYRGDDLREVPVLYDTLMVVRYPETPYVVIIGNMMNQRLQVIQQVIVQVYDAKRITQEQVSGKSMERFRHIIDNHASLGVASTLRMASNDANPLQFEPQKRPAEEDYVNTREQRRRIVPLDHEALGRRLRTTSDIFGVEAAPGVVRLDVDMESSLAGVDESVMRTLPDSDRKIRMNFTIKGKSVMDGLRTLVLNGHIDTPVPLWMLEVASEGVNKVIIRDDKVMKEVDDDTSDEEEDEEEKDGDESLEI